MQNTKNLETVERERERERATFLNKVACISVTLIEILNKINLRNKDPCYGFRLLYLRI